MMAIIVRMGIGECSRLGEFELNEKVISPQMMRHLGIQFENPENSKILEQIAADNTPTNHAVLRGYFQAEKFFRNVKEELRSIYTFRTLIRKNQLH